MQAASIDPHTFALSFDEEISMALTLRYHNMKGPTEIDCDRGSIFYQVKGGSSTIDPSKERCFKYTSDDKSLSCVLFSMIHTGDNVKFYNNEDGTVKQEPENKYLIYPLEGKDRLEEIMKEQKIANDFPIDCKTKEEAEEKLKKLLGYNS
jgi:hypothetical protein